MTSRNRIGALVCAAAWAVIAASFFGCSNDSNLAGPARANEIDAAVSFEGHAHTVTMEAGTRDGERVLFLVLGGATHTHRLALTDRERFDATAGAHIVIRRTSMGFGHAHTVTLN